MQRRWALGKGILGGISPTRLMMGAHNTIPMWSTTPNPNKIKQLLVTYANYGNNCVNFIPLVERHIWLWEVEVEGR